MNTSDIFSVLPVGLVVLLLFLTVIGGLIFYALRMKGDVRAEISHGKTTFKLGVCRE